MMTTGQVNALMAKGEIPCKIVVNELIKNRRHSAGFTAFPLTRIGQELYYALSIDGACFVHTRLG